jgi:ABC-2 type transport system permease protein
MASGNSAMILETGAGWTRGLRNMLRGELGSWFGTRAWLVQVLIWFGSVNLIYLMTAFSSRGAGIDSTLIFNIFMGLVAPIGVTIVMQNEIVGEKRSGTAAWLLSKPVARPSFILAKLIANTTGLLVTMVIAQGIIAYLITGLVVGTWLPVGGFAAALAAHFANVLFYLTLTLMLGVLFEHSAPVIAIPMAFLFAQNFVGPKLAELSPALADVLPWTLAIPLNGSVGQLSVSMALMAGQPTPLTAIWVALGASALFVAVALLVFRRQEL